MSVRREKGPVSWGVGAVFEALQRGLDGWTSCCSRFLPTCAGSGLGSKLKQLCGLEQSLPHFNLPFAPALASFPVLGKDCNYPL